jgi:hypothetical protein
MKKIVFFMLMLGICFSATRYISTTGSDGADCSVGTPCANLTYVIGISANGDTIIVGNGRYNETPNLLNSIWITTGVTIQAQNKWNAIISVNSTTVDNVFYLNGANIVLDGLIVEAKGETDKAEYGVKMFNSASNKISLINLRIWNATSGGIWAASNCGTGAGVDNLLIENNTFENVSSDDIYLASNCHDNMTIKGNTFNIGATSNDYGIRTDTGSGFPKLNHTIRDNVFNFVNDTLNGYGIYEAYNSLANCDINLTIFNNTFGSATTPFRGDGIYLSNLSGTNISNNTFFMADVSTKAAIRFYNQADNSSIYNNTFGSPSFYTNITSGYYMYIRGGNNVSIYNNTMYEGYMYSAITFDVGLPTNVTGPRVFNNTIHANNASSLYALQMGSELYTLSINDAIVEDNTVNITQRDNTDGDVIHTVGLIYTVNGTVRNNTIFGGYYGLVSKGNTNASIYKNTFLNNSLASIYDKGGYNCSYYNNTITQYGNRGEVFWMSEDNANGRTVSGARFYNNTIYMDQANSSMTIAIKNTTNVTDFSYNENIWVVPNLQYSRFTWMNGTYYAPRAWLTYSRFDLDSLFCPGNINNCSKIDIDNPNVTFVAPTPSNNSNLSRTWIDVNVTTADAFAISNVTVYIYNSSGSLVTSNSSSISNSSFFTNFTGLANGVYYLNATINDTSGNNNTAGTLNITLDTVSPAINFVFPTDATNTSLNITNLVINVTATDSLSGLKNLTIFLYNESGVLENTSNTTSSPLFVNFTGLRNGIYYFNATAFDQANNSNSTATWNVTIDNVAPYFNATYIPSADYYTADQTQTFAFVINDAYSRTMNCSVYIDGTNVHTNSTVTNGTKLIFDYTLALGKHNWSATCRDNANNTNSTDTRNFTIVARATSTGSGSSESKTVLYPKTKFDCFTGKITIDVGEANGEVLQLMKEGVPPSIITTKKITDGKVEFIIPSSGTYSIVPYQFTSKYVLSISTETYTLCPATTEVTTPLIQETTTPEVIVPETTPTTTPETVPEVTTPSITKEEVLVIISSADSAIVLAVKENKDVSGAKAKLTEANVLIASGDLEGAKKLAEEALALVKSAKAKATTPATTAPTYPTGNANETLNIGLIAIAVIAIIIISAFFLFKSKNKSR